MTEQVLQLLDELPVHGSSSRAFTDDSITVGGLVERRAHTFRAIWRFSRGCR